MSGTDVKDEVHDCNEQTVTGNDDKAEFQYDVQILRDALQVRPTGVNRE